WLRLRDRLHQFDRADVLRQSLALHEAVLQDRDRWQRTARAVIALHASSEDVFSVARRREKTVEMWHFQPEPSWKLLYVRVRRALVVHCPTGTSTNSSHSLRS